MNASVLRRLWALAGIGAAAALGCGTPLLRPYASRPSDELLRDFREGHVRLDCSSCRFDFRDADWMLRDGHPEALVVSILRSGDGSGRSWYLLGRAAELTHSPAVALLYYTRSLTTSRNPIVPLWPLYEDVTYRIREIARTPDPAAVASAQAAAAKASSRRLEFATQDAVAVHSRPGQLGAFLLTLNRGDPVEVLDRSGDWEQVRILPSGRVGWVWARYTSATASGPAPAKETATAKADAPAPVKSASDRAAAAKKAAAPKPTAGAKPGAAPKASAPAQTAAAKPAKEPAPTAKPAPAVAATYPLPARVELSRARGLGILGSPLPEGARLAGQSHGLGGNQDHPTETYEIPAAAGDIVGFYEREMERAGWRKSFVSSEFLLYFVKEERTLGVLIERDGGTFTLMGS